MTSQATVQHHTADCVLAWQLCQQRHPFLTVLCYVMRRIDVTAFIDKRRVLAPEQSLSACALTYGKANVYKASGLNFFTAHVDTCFKTLIGFPHEG